MLFAAYINKKGAVQPVGGNTEGIRPRDARSATAVTPAGAQRPVGANAENGVHPRYVRNVTTDTPVNSIAENTADVKAKNPTTADGGPPPFDKGGFAAKDRTGRLDENTRTVFEAIGRAFDVDVEYVESLDDGSWGRMETALRRMTVSEERP